MPKTYNSLTLQLRGYSPQVVEEGMNNLSLHDQRLPETQQFMPQPSQQQLQQQQQQQMHYPAQDIQEEPNIPFIERVIQAQAPVNHQNHMQQHLEHMEKQYAGIYPQHQPSVKLTWMAQRPQPIAIAQVAPIQHQFRVSKTLKIPSANSRFPSTVWNFCGIFSTFCKNQRYGLFDTCHEFL